MRRRDVLGFMSVALQPPKFGGSARLVQAPVTVTGADGRKIGGLEQRDFLLFDGGERREFTLDDVPAPLSLMVAVQTGGGFRGGAGQDSQEASAVRAAALRA
jgi:hypothetical protein